MFFKESERLVAKHPQLKDLIEQIDKKLTQFDASGLARVADFSTFFKEGGNRITGIFEGFVAEGLLGKVEIVDCMNCQTLSSAAEYRAHLTDHKAFPCSSCGVLPFLSARPVE